MPKSYFNARYFAAGYFMDWLGSYGSSYGPDEADDGKLVPAGHWKHLFKPACSAEAPAVKVVGSSHVAVVRPEVTWGREDTAVVIKTVTVTAKVSLHPPCTGTAVQLQTARGVSRVGRVRLRSGATLYAGRVYGSSAVFAYTSAGCSVRSHGVTSHGYVGRAVVKTVQNLPEEVLLSFI